MDCGVLDDMVKINTSDDYIEESEECEECEECEDIEECEDEPISSKSIKWAYCSIGEEAT